MKNTHACPKCQSTDVIRIAGSKMDHNKHLRLTKWGLKSVLLDRYLCVGCGFTEEWIQFDNAFDRWVDKNHGRLAQDDGFV